MDKWISRHRSAGCAAVIGAGVRGQAVVGPWSGDAAGSQRVPGVRMESLRADSVFSRGFIQRPPARVAGPCRGAVSAGSAPDGQDTGLRWRCSRRVRCSRADPGVRVCAGAPAVRRLEIDPPGRRGEAVAGP